VIFSIAVSPTLAAEKCIVESELQPYNDDHVECYFYQGTEAYRAEQYDVSREKWEALLALRNVEETAPGFAMLANSNLGYLYFWGLGGDSDADAAVAYLRRAAASGGEEAHKHLCYAYGYTDSDVHNPSKARRHCLLARTIYSARTEPTKSDLRTIEDMQSPVRR